MIGLGILRVTANNSRARFAEDPEAPYANRWTARDSCGNQANCPVSPYTARVWFILMCALIADLRPKFQVLVARLPVSESRITASYRGPWPYVIHPRLSIGTASNGVSVTLLTLYCSVCCVQIEMHSVISLRYHLKDCMP